jgi:hypothetical protein
LAISHDRLGNDYGLSNAADAVMAYSLLHRVVDTDGLAHDVIEIGGK